MDKAQLRQRIAELEGLLARKPSEGEDIYRTLSDSQLAAQEMALREAIAGFEATLAHVRGEQKRRGL